MTSSSAFEVSTYDEANYTVLKFKGPLVLGNDGPQALEDAAKKIMISKKEPHVLLDLSEMTRLDSKAIGTLVSILQSVHKHGGSLTTLVHAKIPGHTGVIEKLETTRLAPVFGATTDREEAVANLLRKPTVPAVQSATSSPSVPVVV